LKRPWLGCGFRRRNEHAASANSKIAPRGDSNPCVPLDLKPYKSTISTFLSTFPYGGGYARDVINGKEVGVSFGNSTRSYYMMIPQKSGRTKRKWLGRDKEKAVVKFRAIVSQLKGEKEKFITVDINLNISQVFHIF
jgi:hypothetical protein